jgi:NAD(P)H-dependent FMN reductase
MQNKIKIAAVIGSYRKGGIIDSVVDVILAAARDEGAETGKIYLTDTRIEFCTNCRVCMQDQGSGRGICPIADEMGSLLDELEKSDAIVLASPTNFGTVTAIMKRFMERLACYAYWPWGMNAPQMRIERKEKPAIVVASSAAPAILARLMTRIVGILKKSVDAMGCRTIGVLFIGLAAQQQNQALSGRTVMKARSLGRELVTSAKQQSR